MCWRRGSTCDPCFESCLHQHALPTPLFFFAFLNFLDISWQFTTFPPPVMWPRPCTDRLIGSYRWLPSSKTPTIYTRMKKAQWLTVVFFDKCSALRSTMHSTSTLLGTSIFTQWFSHMAAAVKSINSNPVQVTDFSLMRTTDLFSGTWLLVSDWLLLSCRCWLGSAQESCWPGRLILQPLTTTSCCCYFSKIIINPCAQLSCLLRDINLKSLQMFLSRPVGLLRRLCPYSSTRGFESDSWHLFLYVKSLFLSSLSCCSYQIKTKKQKRKLWPVVTTPHCSLSLLNTKISLYRSSF